MPGGIKTVLYDVNFDTNWPFMLCFMRDCVRARACACVTGQIYTRTGAGRAECDSFGISGVEGLVSQRVFVGDGGVGGWKTEVIAGLCTEECVNYADNI